MLLAFGCTACSVAPLLPSESARALGAGNHRIGLYNFPTIGIAYGRGIGDDLDVGLTVDASQMAALRAKYTFVSRPRFAAAIEARAFAGFDEVIGRARGVGAGPLVEIGRGRLTLVTGARYNALSHETYAEDQDGGVISYPSPRTGQDYGAVLQAYAFLGLGIGRVRLLLGASCDHYASLDAVPDPDGDVPETSRCLPVLGLDVPWGGS